MENHYCHGILPLKIIEQYETYTINKRDIYFYYIFWHKKILSQAQLVMINDILSFQDNMLTELGSTLASLQTTFQSLCQMRNSMTNVYSHQAID